MQDQLEKNREDMAQKLVDISEKIDKFIAYGLKFNNLTQNIHDTMLGEVSKKLADRQLAVVTLETKLDNMQQLLQDVSTKLDETLHQLDMKLAGIDEKLDTALTIKPSSDSASASSSSWNNEL